MLKPSARARKIKLLLFDVDGVLTDGKLFFLPVREQNPQAASELHAQGSIELKGFHVHDGVAIVLARIGGLRTGLITTRFSETVALRARDLKIEFVRQGIQDKRSAFEGIIKEIGIKPGEAAFIGDDFIDLPSMLAGGMAIAVKNARPEVKKVAHYVTPHSGGEGALRDAVEFILKAQGKWKTVFEAYMKERTTSSGN